MQNCRRTRYPSPSRRLPFARVGEWLAVAKIRRRKAYAMSRPYAAPRRRRPLSAQLANVCRCLAERLDTRWSRAVGKMAITAAAVAVVYMIIGNSLQQSFSRDIQRLGLEKQQYEKEHVLIQVELTSLVKKNKDRLGLTEGKPEQLVRMN